LQAEASFLRSDQNPTNVCGISPSFPRLSPIPRQITHVLLTRSPLSGSRSRLRARLACVKHAASVHSEPGSNSPVWILRPARSANRPAGFCSESAPRSSTHRARHPKNTPRTPKHPQDNSPDRHKLGSRAADFHSFSLSSFQRTDAVPFRRRILILRRAEEAVKPDSPAPRKTTGDLHRTFPAQRLRPTVDQGTCLPVRRQRPAPSGAIEESAS
jgi:hypothetical protein